MVKQSNQTIMLKDIFKQKEYTTIIVIIIKPETAASWWIPTTKRTFTIHCVVEYETKYGTRHVCVQVHIDGAPSKHITLFHRIEWNEKGQQKKKITTTKTIATPHTNMRSRWEREVRADVIAFIRAQAHTLCSVELMRIMTYEISIIEYRMVQGRRGPYLILFWLFYNSRNSIFVRFHK